MSTIKTTTIFTVVSKTDLSNYLTSALIWLTRGWDRARGWEDGTSRVSITKGGDFDSTGKIVSTVTLETPERPDEILLVSARFSICGSCPRIAEATVSEPTILGLSA